MSLSTLFHNILLLYNLSRILIVSESIFIDRKRKKVRKQIATTSKEKLARLIGLDVPWFIVERTSKSLLVSD